MDVETTINIVNGSLFARFEVNKLLLQFDQFDVNKVYSISCQSVEE